MKGSLQCLHTVLYFHVTIDDWQCLFFLSVMFRILWKKNEVADYEATTFSIFYNNTLFLVLVIVASFFLLKNFNPTVYPFVILYYQSSLYGICLIARNLAFSITNQSLCSGGGASRLNSIHWVRYTQEGLDSWRTKSWRKVISHDLL